MFRKAMLAAIAAGGLAFAAGDAVASTIQFDLGGSQSTDKSSFSYSVGGVDLTVSGLRCNDGQGPNHWSCKGEKIDRYGVGIAMDQGPGDDHQVDGKNSNEFLKLAFSPSITLTSLTFTYASRNDEFSLYSWTGSLWDLEGSASACVSLPCGENSKSQTYVFNGTYTGSYFLVGALGADDDWKLKGVSVHYEDPSVVPLPAAGWLLLAGVGGIAAMRRKTAA